MSIVHVESFAVRPRVDISDGMKLYVILSAPPLFTPGGSISHCRAPQSRTVTPVPADFRQTEAKTLGWDPPLGLHPMIEKHQQPEASNGR